MARGQRVSTAFPPLTGDPTCVACPQAVRDLVDRYVERLELPTDRLVVTCDRKQYGAWLGRRIPSAYGGAYCYVRHADIHAVLINLERINQELPWAVEVVVAEELVHMRDHLDGDHRRHAHHGHDRIAWRVSDLTGVPVSDLPKALIPVQRRPHRWVYECPACGTRIVRKKRGTWSCGRCNPTFDLRFVLRLVGEVVPEAGKAGDVQ